MQNAFRTNGDNVYCFQNETLFNSQFIAMDSIPSPQTILTMHDKLTISMLPASVKNSHEI